MAKELPYFKFEPNQWENGNIQIMSREIKGLFIDICSMYWSRTGDLPTRLVVNKLCAGDDSNIKDLEDEEIISIVDNKIVIDFLDNQLISFKEKSDKASDSSKSRWSKTPERIQGQKVYVIRCWNDSENFLKIGETSGSISRRFSGKIPYNYEALIVDVSNVNDLESQYCEIAKGCEYTPKKEFSGKLECFNISAFDLLSKFAVVRNAEYIFRNAIREDKKREEEKREEVSTLPSLEEFITYAKEKVPTLDQTALKLKYDSWIENDWKTGGDKPRKIKNWKTTLNNTIPYLPKVQRRNYQA